MNESHQNLYNLLTEQGLYTKSYDDFTSQFDAEDKQQKLYDLLQQQELYTKSYDDFTQQFFSQKKKDGPSESDASPFGGSEPGDLSWSVRKFMARGMSYGPSFIRDIGSDVLYDMEQFEKEQVSCV